MRTESGQLTEKRLVARTWEQFLHTRLAQRTTHVSSASTDRIIERLGCDLRVFLLVNRVLGQAKRVSDAASRQLRDALSGDTSVDEESTKIDSLRE
jgi:hypothetical protein